MIISAFFILLKFILLHEKRYIHLQFVYYFGVLITLSIIQTAAPYLS